MKPYIISIIGLLLGAFVLGYAILNDGDAPSITVEDEAAVEEEKPEVSRLTPRPAPEPVVRPDSGKPLPPKPEVKGNGILRGKVQFEDASPVSLAHVFLTGYSDVDGQGAERYAKTVADGLYELADLPDGTFTIETRTKFFAPIRQSVTMNNGVADFDGVITLRNGGTLAGTVTDFDPESDKAQWMKMSWSGEEDDNHGLTVELSLVTSTDYAGTLARIETSETLTNSFLVDRLPPGAWNVVVKYGRHTIANKEGVVIENGRQTQLDLEMVDQAPKGGPFGGGFTPPNPGLSGGEMDEETRLKTLETVKSRLADTIAKFEKSFAEMDMNGDGYLDGTDWPDSSSDALEDKHLKRFDTDSDGRVSKDEYMNSPQINMLKARIEDLSNE